MALTPRPLPWGEGATTLYDVLEKGHQPHGSMEGWLRVTRAVLIGCQVSADAHAPRRLTSHLPCLPGPDNPELFHAKGQRRAVQAQAHCGPLGAREHPFGLLQRRQDERPLTRFERLQLPTLLVREGPGPQVVEWHLKHGPERHNDRAFKA